MSDCTEQSFLKDVAAHEMIVLRDDGVYRHIRFKKPDTGCMYFDLITWPGYLCYSGDMGCYVFSRLNDMFEFFRTDREHMSLRNGATLAINKGYWSEKLTAVDGNRRNGGATEYSPDRFRLIVKEQLVDWMRERDLNKAQRRELRDEVEQDVLSAADDGDVRAYDAATNFRATVGGNTYEFSDFYENDLTAYTYSFVWCCYALAWGIQKYDDVKGGAA